MSSWHIWRAAFDQVTLRDDGDALEIRAAVQHGLDAAFPNYQILWRYHIVPATNRPANIDLRNDAAREIGQIGMLSHSLFGDLVSAADSLALIRSGNLGGDRFKNCTDAIKSDGDAVQKFTDLQKAVENSLASALRRQLQVWPKADWDSRWCPSRERIVGYRNFLTHLGQPQVMLVPQPSGELVPYVLHQDYMVRGNYLTWSEQEAVYRSNPEKWAKLTDVCEELHRDSIAWLNDAYGEIIHALQPLLTDEDYQWLWGWDTAKLGRHVLKRAGIMGTQAPMGSGSAVGAFIPGSGQAGS